ncbi:MAG: twin-arginine translocase subunit TatC [Bacteroidales bacterium]
MAKENTNEPLEMGFLDHLEILRWHLIRSVLSIVVFGVAAFIFRDFIFDTVILAPKSPTFFTNKMLCKFGTYIDVPALCINSKPFQIINIKMAGQFSTHIMVSLVAGLIAAFPYVFWEIWRFIKPALYTNEKQHARGAVFYSSALFILGVLFGYYVLVPLSLDFLGGYNVSNQVLNQINLDSYISTFTSVVLASGVVFELPIIIFFLSKAGLITPEFLKTYRKHAAIVILIVAAIITPPDIFSQILVSLPLFMLYELGILISRRVVKKKEKQTV